MPPPTWRHLGSFYTAPGFTNEYMHLYLATDLSPIEGYTGPDVDERLSLERVPWRDAVGRALRGELADAKSLLALLWLERMVAHGELAIDDSTRLGRRARPPGSQVHRPQPGAGGETRDAAALGDRLGRRSA